MEVPVVHVGATADVAAACADTGFFVLADHGDRKPYAVVTDRDLLRVAHRFDELTAGEIATETVLEARVDEPLSDAARRMADHDATHAVVVDERSGRPVGVLSTLDIAGILGWGLG